VEPKLHAVDFKSADIANAKILEISHQLSVNPERSTAITLPWRVGFHHELVAVPTVS
jgi:hypothetical protein